MSKLSRTDAQAQGRRLQSVIPSAFPKATADEMRAEVVGSLVRNCVDVAHASRTVTMVLDSSPDPKNLIAEIRRCAAETQDRQQILPDGCERCLMSPDPNTGAPRWSAHVYGEKRGYSCAIRCSCERGRWLERRDQERMAEVRKPKPQADLMRIAAGDSDE
jgi:hypothetical protein